MSGLSDLKLRIKRGEGPVYGFLRKVIVGTLRSNLPIPRFLQPLLRNFYELHFAIIVLFRRAVIYFYREPLFRSRCASVGRNLTLYTAMPYVESHGEIHLGDDVTLMGELTLISGRLHQSPVLQIGDRVTIGDSVVISFNQQVVIEEDVMIANHCRIADNDGHPREAHLRIAHAPLRPRDIRPVRIARRAWIGTGAQIFKGVTIGEGAIIGAYSVVISDIPEYSIAMGNPAEVYFRNVGRPKLLPVETALENS